MLSSKSKSSMSDLSSKKSTPPTPRVSKIGKMGSAKVDPDSTPQQNPRSSIERSPRSVSLKPIPDRPSPKTISPPDKHPRPLKESELRAQLTLVQDDLKKAKEKLASEEEEKALTLEELREAKKAREEANVKLEDALLSQKMAEERSELDKFRADELEQWAIEAAQKREEEWLQELGNVRNQHAVDAAALISATQELQRVKQELVMVSKAKDTALGHANDAMKIAEENVPKIDILSGEINHLKSLMDSMLESHSKEMEEIIEIFDSKAEVLKLEFDKAKASEKHLAELEGLVEGLEAQVLNVKMNESNALILLDEWRKKVELLELQLEEANRSEKELKSSLDSAMKKLEERQVMCNDAKSDIASLEGKVEVLGLEVTRYKEDLKESDRKLDLLKQEILDMQSTAEVLKSEIQKLEEEKAQSLNNEKIACLNVETLSEENNKLAVELELTRGESEKAQKAMEGLASALHELSMEVRDGQERLLIKQSQFDSAAADVVELKSALKNTQEKNELVLDEANYEIVCLKKSIEKSETEMKDLRDVWDLKESNLISAIKKLEEEISSIKFEKDKAMEELEKQRDEAKHAEEEASMLLEKMKQAEIALVAANKSLEKEMAETFQLKERLLDKENELQSITQENEELQIRDTAASGKIKELSKSLALLSSTGKENGDVGRKEGIGEISNSYKENDLLPTAVMHEKVIETSTKESEAPTEKSDDLKMDTKQVAIENVYGNSEENNDGHANSEEEEPVKVEVQLSSEWEDNTESVDDEPDSKIENSNLDLINGMNAKNVNKPSPIKEQQQQQQHRKKKPLLQKFGNMLKKKSGTK